jgi:hypothetical protein
MLSTWKQLKHCRDAEEAEALACLEGVLLARSWQDRRLIMETDCASVLGKLMAGDTDKSVTAPIIRDTLLTASLLSNVRYSKIGRDQNKAAHELAHLAIRLGENGVSITTPPECVMGIVCNEAR